MLPIPAFPIILAVLSFTIPHHTVHHRHAQHREKFHYRPVELCEANYESGEPGAYTLNTINWRMDSEGYEGAFSWLPSTWGSERFPGYPYRAVDATPEQQTLVFRRYKSVSAWPPLAHCL